MVISINSLLMNSGLKDSIQPDQLLKTKDFMEEVVLMMATVFSLLLQLLKPSFTKEFEEVQV